MIQVRIGELEAAATTAVVRPVASDFSPVTGAMRRFDDAAGPAVRDQCHRLGELPVGSAAITAAGDLAPDYVVHVAVRDATQNAGPDIVRNGLLNALRRLDDWGIDSVAVAPLGTGAGNLDPEESADLMVPLLVRHTLDTGVPGEVVIVVDDAYQLAVFEAAVARHKGAREANAGP
jgi:O-acetyl-ADP-ribose deacetylase (regulator of RNase III)